MQTFLPYPDFEASARVLDRSRLQKQRVECKQILKALLGMYPSGAWSNHPATKMWRGHESTLRAYALAIHRECDRRGIADRVKISEWFANLELPETSPPAWLGDEYFHASHRSNLLRKNPDFYQACGWTEVDYLPYVWPVK